MKILTGLFEHMVLQRNRQNVSDAVITGETAGSGVIRCRVRQNGKDLNGFGKVQLGRSAGRRFQAVLKGLPAGGPYEIELSLDSGAKTVPESLTVRDVLVGDVWLLGGQSNMQGIGRLPNGLGIDPLVRAFFMNDTWKPAKDPLHILCQAVDQVHVDLNGGYKHGPQPPHIGAGPGVAFGQKMRELTGVPQGVIACAHGGTTMTQWDPKLKKLGARSLYGAMLRRFAKNGGKAAGLVWYQGCSDANTEAAALYTRRTKEFIMALRRDTAIPNLPVALVQIARVVGWTKETVAPWNSIQEQQRRLPELISACTTVPAIDLTMDDSIHISGKDQIRLGYRLAQAMQVLRADRRAGLPPIALKKVTMVPDEVNEMVGNVIVEFENVKGTLKSGGRPSGFEIVGGDSECSWYDLKLKGNCAILRSTQALENLTNMQLYYGYGHNPYCNITDAADRSLPMFGPVPIAEPKVLSRFVRTVEISRLLPGAGKLENVVYPADTKPLKFKSRTYAGDFCDLHPELGSRAPEDLLVYYRFQINCPEAMKLMVRFGYDGPVKLWIDGQEKWHDPKGMNPATPNKGMIPFAAKAGRHELLVALGSNHGRAWGVMLRFERPDVSKAKLKLGPDHFPMPQVIEEK